MHVLKDRSLPASLYTREYFAEHETTVSASAERILPAVLALLDPESVIDVGCGTGTWLRVAQTLGVNHVSGIDFNGLGPESLEIPAASVLECDLRYAIPPSVGQHDLALCLEVGEHLPESAADGLVKSLTNLAPAVLFSAAVPQQGGVGHVNEQWPGYWAALFAEYGFDPFDVFRFRFWLDQQVSWWYRQNIMLYLSRDYVSAHPALGAAVGPATFPLPLVHPDCWATALATRTQVFTRLGAGTFLRAMKKLVRATGSRIRRGSA